MIFQRINRNSPEKIFIVVGNSWSTAALTAGQAVAWDLTDADGFHVTRPTARATSGGAVAAGIISDASIAPGGYGLMQVYGFHPAVRMRVASGGVPAIVPGRPLAINAAGGLFCLESVATSSISITTYPVGFALDSTSGWTTATRKAFVKAL